MVSEIMELVVHIPRRIDVDASSNQRDHAKHHNRERVDVVAQGELETSKLTELVILARVVGGRPVVGMAGGLLSALAALASSFANDVPTLCVTYGLLNGRSQ